MLNSDHAGYQAVPAFLGKSTMNTRKSRSFRPSFDDNKLENRLALSTVHAHVEAVPLSPPPVVHPPLILNKPSTAFDATGSAFRTTVGMSSKTIAFTNQLILTSPQIGTLGGTSSATYTVKDHIAKGVETYTANGGSQLKLQIEGKFGTLGPDDVAVGTYKVIGGTGLFADAKGKGTFLALPVAADGTRGIGYSGTLTF